ncbi:MAG TPA: exonuclease SbcCD subunit D [Ktedonobacterales bacterium]|nr:exonuclease SbcCD subunit D [Ktedonobacterales bacterium]
MAMRATFVHTADNHLGYEQYGSRERFDDFAKAFLHVVDDAIERRADFFVVSGDLFNKRAIDALTLIQAREALQRLSEAGIPAIGIEGNHDRSYYRDGVSWLQFLAYLGVLKLLSPVVRDGAPELTEWSQRTMQGLYVPLKDGRLRVYGLPWYGASTARVMRGLAETLQAGRAEEDAAGVEYRVLLMHTGVEGILPQLQGLPTRADFEPLRGLVDYVALGHVHKPYEIDNWLFNPGSTETWGAEESAWDRGFYAVRVDTAVAEGESKHVAEHITNPRRPFVRFSFRVDGLSDPASFYDHFERLVRQQAREHADALERKAVVDVALTGVYAFEGDAVERTRLEDMVKEQFHPLIARIHDSARSNAYELDGVDEGDERTDRQALELRVFEDLLARDARFQGQASEWAGALSTMKRMALDGESPENIALALRDARTRLLRQGS